MEKSVQLEMFDLASVPEERPRAKACRYYYITRKRNAEMLFNIARDGRAEWCENDTRFAQPVLYNSAASARRDMKKHRGDNVKRWYWRLRNRER